MCGPTSAIGLDDAERAVWLEVRERLRPPGRMMALMRGVLGGDTEVAAVTAVTPAGVVEPLALVATAAIVDEITLTDVSPREGVRSGRVGDYDVDVLMDDAGERVLAVLVSPWIFEHLTLYGRKLWTRRPPRDAP